MMQYKLVRTNKQIPNQQCSTMHENRTFQNIKYISHDMCYELFVRYPETEQIDSSTYSYQPVDTN